MCGYAHTCAYACQGKGQSSVSFSEISFILQDVVSHCPGSSPLRLAWLASKPQVPPPQHWDYKRVTLYLNFYVGSGHGTQVLTLANTLLTESSP